MEHLLRVNGHLINTNRLLHADLKRKTLWLYFDSDERCRIRGDDAVAVMEALSSRSSAPEGWARIDASKLSLRAQTVLRKLSETTNDPEHVTKRDIIGFRNCGPKASREILHAFETAGFVLKEHPTDPRGGVLVEYQRREQERVEALYRQ